MICQKKDMFPESSEESSDRGSLSCPHFISLFNGAALKSKQGSLYFMPENRFHFFIWQFNFKRT